MSNLHLPDSIWLTIDVEGAPKEKPSKPTQNVADEVDELSIEQSSLLSAPQPVRRAPMADKDPNRQIITGPEGRADHGSTRSKTVSRATHAEEKPSKSIQDVADEVDELSIEQPSLLPAPRSVRRALMADKDPNRQIINGPEGRADHESTRLKTVSGTTHVGKPERYVCLPATTQHDLT